MIEWKHEHLVAFIELVRQESKTPPTRGSDQLGGAATQRHMQKITHHLQMISDAASGDSHAQNNILTILQAKETLDGSQKENNHSE